MEMLRRVISSRSVLALSLGIFALVFLAPAANADVTIHHIMVNVGGVTYCDAGTSGCSVTEAWNFGPSGLTLSGAAGQTLVLTQSGTTPMPNVPGGVGQNFDTSDMAGPNGAFSCTTSSPCPVSLFIDFGSGFPATPQYANSSSPLNQFNGDTSATTNGPEGLQYTTVFTVPNSYTLNLAYADTAHPGIGAPVPICTSSTTPTLCVPNPWIDSNNGNTAATFSFGTGLSTTVVPGFPASCGSYCFDGGAIMIQALASIQPPPPCTFNLTIANTSWNSFNVPSGKSAVVWLNAHIGTPSGIPTNTTTQVTFTNGTLTVNGSTFTLPNGVMNFDPTAGSPTTTYNAITNTWTTTVNPNSLSDELFFDGDAIPVTAALTQSGKATVSFTVGSQSTNLALKWLWSAAVYTFWPTDWNQAMILAYHHADHAGTPESQAVQQSLIQGPRGGGGSNFTGSWSATGSGSCTP